MQCNKEPESKQKKSGTGAPAVNSTLVIRITKVHVTILKRTQSDIKPHWNERAFERRCSL